MGAYTDDAKVAIQKMLGIYEAPWELIREDTVTNDTEADIEITVDGNGQSFELTDVYLEFWLTAETQEATSTGRVEIYYSNSRNFTQYFGSTTVAIGENPRGACLLIENKKGAIIRQNTPFNIIGTDRKPISTPGRVDTNRSYMISGDYIFQKINIKSVKGTGHYRFLGKRKWN